MSVTEQPTITKGLTQNFTKVTFWPDLKRFQMTRFEDDIISLFTKRVYDIAGVTDGRVKVELNGKPIEIKTFVEYTDLYLSTVENKSLPKVIEKKSDRWEVVCSLSDG
jgi:DNA topoisomerase-2